MWLIKRGTRQLMDISFMYLDINFNFNCLSVCFLFCWRVFAACQPMDIILTIRNRPNLCLL